MEYRIILDLDGDSDLARALKERVESPQLGAATALVYQGVRYSIAPEGIYVKLNAYTAEIPDAYKGIVKKVAIKAHVPSHPAPTTPGLFKRGRTTASVERYDTNEQTLHLVVVEGPELGRVNRLFNDIRTGKADKARSVKWDERPDSEQ
ncbi:MAG TPA: hypothetical protein VLI05_01505 [Candidatus Saccharimonadia bacterium]|nr:hypothetical protein [Candidatus Saccharimonadia bacterium]